jgi:hypothetical protein
LWRILTVSGVSGNEKCDKLTFSRDVTEGAVEKREWLHAEKLVKMHHRKLFKENA